MQVMDRFNETYRLTDAELRTPNCKPFDYDEMKRDILKSIDWFVDAPFTIQRLCELLVAPNEYYRRTDKFLRGIEKNVMVVSTTQPRASKYSPEPYVLLLKSPTLTDCFEKYSGLFMNIRFEISINVTMPHMLDMLTTAMEVET